MYNCCSPISLCLSIKFTFNATFPIEYGMRYNNNTTIFCVQHLLHFTLQWQTANISIAFTTVVRKSNKNKLCGCKWKWKCIEQKYHYFLHNYKISAFICQNIVWGETEFAILNACSSQYSNTFLYLSFPFQLTW